MSSPFVQIIVSLLVADPPHLIDFYEYPTAQPRRLNPPSSGAEVAQGQESPS